MSFIIKTLPNGTPLPDKGKDFLLMQEADGHIISPPDEFQEGLVCILHDELSDKAVFCFSEGEMGYYLEYVHKQKTWLIVPQAAKIAVDEPQSTI